MLLPPPPAKLEVNVPAVWHAVDLTGNPIPGLNPIKVYPDMSPYPPEIAVYNNVTGEYEISFNGLSETNSAYAFIRAEYILFTDRFHRVVAQGLIPGDEPISNEYGFVLRIKYGDQVYENINGIDGMAQIPYQAGKKMDLYLAVKENENLSIPTYKDESVVVTNSMSHAEIIDALKKHIVKVDYLDLNSGQAELNLGKLDKLYIYKHTSDTTGAFIPDGDSYKNFMNAGLADLPDGKYEAVFPIYWQKELPSDFGSLDIFVRNRYKLDDTFHFTFTKKTVSANGNMPMVKTPQTGDNNVVAISVVLLLASLSLAIIIRKRAKSRV